MMIKISGTGQNGPGLKLDICSIGGNLICEEACY